MSQTVGLFLSTNASRWGFTVCCILAEAPGRQPVINTVQIDAISSGLQEVTGTERTAPEGATLRGPLLVVPLRSILM